MHQPHEMTLHDYCGTAPVRPVRDDSPFTAHAENLIRQMNSQPDRFAGYDKSVGIGGGYSVRMSENGKRSPLLVCPSDTVAGIILPYSPYVSAQHRGKGLWARMRVVADRHVPQKSTVYSPSGYKSKIKAHQIHVNIARRRGIAIPEEVLRDYRADGEGFLRLLRAPTADEQNRLAASTGGFIPWRDSSAISAFSLMERGFEGALSIRHDAWTLVPLLNGIRAGVEDFVGMEPVSVKDLAGKTGLLGSILGHDAVREVRVRTPHEFLHAVRRAAPEEKVLREASSMVEALIMSRDKRFQSQMETLAALLRGMVSPETSADARASAELM